MLSGWLETLLAISSTVLIICVQVPLFLFALLPISFFYYVLHRFYISTYRQLSRLESVHHSPIFSHFAESLSGVATIRAYGHAQRFTNDANLRVDTYLRINYLMWN